MPTSKHIWQYIIRRYTPPTAWFSPFPKTDSHLAVGHVAHCCGKPSLQWVQSPATWGAHTWKLSNLGDLITHYVQKAGVLPLHLTLVHLKKNFYGCFCICTYVCTPLGAWFPWKPEWVLEWLEPEVTDSYETPCWCWESTWNLLGEHPGCCSMWSKTFFGLQEIDLHTCSIRSHTEKMFFKKCLWGYGRICVANSMRLFWNEVIFMRDKM